MLWENKSVICQLNIRAGGEQIVCLYDRAYNEHTRWTNVIRSLNLISTIDLQDFNYIFQLMHFSIDELIETNLRVNHEIHNHFIIIFFLLLLKPTAQTQVGKTKLFTSCFHNPTSTCAKENWRKHISVKHQRFTAPLNSSSVPVSNAV